MKSFVFQLNKYLTPLSRKKIQGKEIVIMTFQSSAIKFHITIEFFIKRLFKEKTPYFRTFKHKFKF